MKVDLTNMRCLTKGHTAKKTAAKIKKTSELNNMIGSGAANQSLRTY